MRYKRIISLPITKKMIHSTDSEAKQDPVGLPGYFLCPSPGIKPRVSTQGGVLYCLTHQGSSEYLVDSLARTSRIQESSWVLLHRRRFYCFDYYQEALSSKGQIQIVVYQLLLFSHPVLSNSLRPMGFSTQAALILTISQSLPQKKFMY